MMRNQFALQKITIERWEKSGRIWEADEQEQKHQSRCFTPLPAP